jgi:spermidine synthase
LFFLFFLVSGSCALVYEVVWLRLAMAAFGVTTPLVSIVLSVFMAGLGLGSWGAGRLARHLAERSSPDRFLRLYAITEMVIGAGGLLVAHELDWARRALQALGASAPWASGSHYLGAGVLVTVALLPFCAAMGATFPLGMAALRPLQEAKRESSAAGTFSYLYVANVVGAALGTLLSAVMLIELLGFRGTLQVTALLNGLLAMAAFALSIRSRSGEDAGIGAHPVEARRTGVTEADAPPAAPAPVRSAIPKNVGASRSLPAKLRAVPWLLFSTGLLSMGMEVVWVRQFTPYLGTVVYTFAAILTVYLVATFLGSAAYRWSARRRPTVVRTAWGPGALLAVALLAALPTILADPRVAPPGGFAAGLVRVAVGIGPFCFALGHLTPRLVDLWSHGDPARAGSAYALNVLGCIAGPLVASFGLLPIMGERWALAVLALPLYAFVLTRPRTASRANFAVLGGLALAAGLGVVALTKDYETIFFLRKTLRDHSATVIATGEGMNKRLLVNGYGMTSLTPITKMMAHLPLAVRAKPPERVLVVCFGMGTSFRSALTWGASTTAVELIPSVPDLFDFYHPDAARVRALPGAHVVIDDGRRFLERTGEDFDVITVDPPPPVEAAGSSLLYSKEFFEAARARLRTDGVFQQWLPTPAEPIVIAAIARALKDSFVHVRAFPSEFGWGIHFLASQSPIPLLAPDRLVDRMPSAARTDLVEWRPGMLPVEPLAAVLTHEIPLDHLIGLVPGTRPLTDDLPVNEYYLLRRELGSAAFVLR